ncbi:hypothetical protein ACMFMG_009007 [Clarireedia jacksonii]
MQREARTLACNSRARDQYVLCSRASEIETDATATATAATAATATTTATVQKHQFQTVCTSSKL